MQQWQYSGGSRAAWTWNAAAGGWFPAAMASKRDSLTRARSNGAAAP
jgi:hypothetical protein